MRRLLTALIVVSALTAATTATATTITVRADGTGDYPTIQDAVDAANPLDEIVLEPGTYTGSGNVNVGVTTPDLTIRGDQGSAVTVIDGFAAIGFDVDLTADPGDFTLTGVSLLNRNQGVRVTLCQDMTLRDIAVRDAQADGVEAHITGHGLVEDCEFVSCGYDGLVLVGMSGVGGLSATVRNVYCHGNGADVPLGGTAMHVNYFASVDVSGNTICHNDLGDHGSALQVENTTGPVVENTIAFNQGGSWAVRSLSPIQLSRNIISSNQGVAMYANYASVSDCNIWDNDGGTGSYGTDLGGNFSADPMFCGIDGSENYYLTSVSPCTSANSPGGVRVGAWPQGCGAVETQETTWGELKSIYR
jgi:hypothetical protein